MLGRSLRRPTTAVLGIRLVRSVKSNNMSRMCVTVPKNKREEIAFSLRRGERDDQSTPSTPSNPSTNVAGGPRGAPSTCSFASRGAGGAPSATTKRRDPDVVGRGPTSGNAVTPWPTRVRRVCLPSDRGAPRLTGTRGATGWPRQTEGDDRPIDRPTDRRTDEK